MMRWLRRLHAWIGLGLCLLLALIALTGATLVFEPQLRHLGRPAAQAPAAGDLPRIIAVAESGFGPDRLASIVFASPDAPWNEVRLKGGGRAWVDRTGGAMTSFGGLDQAYETVFDLHHQLLSGDVGEQVVGWIGVLGALMAVSGVVIWWPARRSFNLTLAPRRPGRAGWLAAHRDVAILVAPMVTLTMLSGAAMALPDIFRPVLAAPAAQAPKDGVTPGGPTNWPVALAAAHARFPAATVRMAVAPARPERAASLRLRQPGEWHANGRTIVFFDPPTGRVLKVYDAQQQNTGARVFNAAWPVHAARVGGYPWKIVVFIGGLGLATLSIYGGEAYRRKLFRR